ncbi:MAG: hypothetical protein WC781_00810 [Candidatus Pacearchaeota archaeon]|jgi:hypothetical protein
MELSDYLEAIKKCPEDYVEIIYCNRPRKIHRLTYEYGVYDNWPIGIGKNLKEFVEYMVSEREYVKPEWWRYTNLDIIDRIPKANYSIKSKDLDKNIQIARKPIDKVSKRYGDREFKEFLSITICNLNYLEETDYTKNTSWERRTAQIVLDIGEFALKEKLPLKFYNSIGWKNREDKSQIIIFPTEEEIKFFTDS